MSDLGLGFGWSAALVIGLGGIVALHALGLSSSHCRDLLHVGAGVWVLGWPGWEGPAVPIFITLFALSLTLGLRALRRRDSVLGTRLLSSLTNESEKLTGVWLYTASYFVFTVFGLCVDPFPAGAALLALSLGDGLGGFVGRRFGRHRFRVPMAKLKTWEGSSVVLLASAIGALVASWIFRAELEIGLALVLGATAAVSEGLSPRSSDNVLVPASVWLVALVLT